LYLVSDTKYRHQIQKDTEYKNQKGLSLLIFEEKHRQMNW